MLNHPTIDQLRAMKLDGMADAFIELSGQEAADAMTHGEWLGVMLNHEAANCQATPGFDPFAPRRTDPPFVVG